MYQKVTKSKTIADRRGTMETETIQKNEASPKSQTSRGNLFNIL